ncbi:hypothetical protein Desaci_2467 [Desulfosporosinus acidiphilus SJ4]|uniref:Uncharacterized protein n=1 Tax=Desulfosporosinus acidiphilus (strain DSM 22704 / JCM 16185 / SJ4) TaxID=646529 RepID=I4D6J1_DESAJ|nr:hypothetical protein [Desulfosporosinus acidiphilus]AFM41415.1 hypothetical protein Desaci_2467 [Desulfosporosinus acidiphilus SJ4]
MSGCSTIMGNASNNMNANQQNTKFWGIWLPVPTFIAILNSLFWTWLILNTVGYTERAIEKAGERITEQF